MTASEGAPISGIVEAAEAEISLRANHDGGADAGERNHQGRLRFAVEVADGAPGRLRLVAIADRDAESDDGPGGTDAPDADPGPDFIGSPAAVVVRPWLQRVIANLKTWALGVYHGLRRPHLQSYLDEFAFRFNRRNDRAAAFAPLLGLALAAGAFTCKMLIGPEVAG